MRSYDDAMDGYWEVSMTQLEMSTTGAVFTKGIKSRALSLDLNHSSGQDIKHIH